MFKIDPKLQRNKNGIPVGKPTMLPPECRILRANNKAKAIFESKADAEVFMDKRSITNKKAYCCVHGHWHIGFGKFNVEEE